MKLIRGLLFLVLFKWVDDDYTKEMACLLTPQFFQRYTLDVAQDLLGCLMQFESKKGVVSGIVCEAEAYRYDDPACHAYLNKETTRNQVMFLAGGHIYVYLIYGMYFCLNVVTEGEGEGCAVLIRGVIPQIGVEMMQENRGRSGLKGLCDGPGKLTQAFGMDLCLNGVFLGGNDCLLSFYEGDCLGRVVSGGRIGLSKGKLLPWRFCLVSE